MSAKRTNLIKIISLFLLFIAVCVGLTQIAQNGSEGQLPLKILMITIDVSRRDELFARLQKFADNHAFEFHLDFHDANKKIFLVGMYRDDLKILAGNVPNDPITIDLGIYEQNPADPTLKKVVNDLVSDLKSFLNEIPNIKIIEE